MPDLFEQFDKIKKGNGSQPTRPAEPPDDAKEFEKILGPRGSIKSGTPGKVPPAGNATNQFIEDYPFTAGVGQGLAGYAEAPAYYAERGARLFDPNFRMPLHERAADIRQRVESTPSGMAGEFVGTMAPAFIPGVGELGMFARGGMAAEDLTRMAQAWRMLSPAGQGALKGAIGGVMSRPATTPEEFRDQAILGGVFGGIGGGAAGRLSDLAAQKAAERAQAAKRASASQRIRQGAQEDARARGAPDIRYTGQGDRFEPIKPEGPLPKVPFKDIPQEEPKYGPTISRGAHIAARTAGFALGHMTPLSGFHRILGHTYADVFSHALHRMSAGELGGLQEYIDSILSRSGRTRSSFASRAGAAGGAIGAYTPLKSADELLPEPERPDITIPGRAQ